MWLCDFLWTVWPDFPSDLPQQSVWSVGLHHISSLGVWLWRLIMIWSIYRSHGSQNSTLLYWFVSFYPRLPLLSLHIFPELVHWNISNNSYWRIASTVHIPVVIIVILLSSLPWCDVTWQACVGECGRREVTRWRAAWWSSVCLLQSASAVSVRPAPCQRRHTRWQLTPISWTMAWWQHKGNSHL